MRNLSVALPLLLTACGGGVPVLMYHSVAEKGDQLTVTPEQLDAHLTWLQQAGFHTVPLRDVVEHRAPADSVVLTFDDGYEDAYRTALPILRKHQMTGTFFIITGGLEHEDARRRLDPITHKPYLLWSELRELQRAGMEIGSHTVHHRKLTEMKPHEIRDELVRSKKELEAFLGHPVELFSYPFTSSHFHIRQAVMKAGYKAAVVGPRGGADEFDVPRYTMAADTSVDKLRALLAANWATELTE